ncbi:MAG TPA: hypothetical protein VFJ53_05370 [Solirubrobacterales bacterium]|nr:hypothetical protein [Solirubrobacterales bacterium]
MYLDLLDAFKDLALRCERYCRKPGYKNLQRFIAAHERVLDRLDDAAAERIDPLIGEQIEGGNAANEQALRILELATDEQLHLEQLLAARVGFGAIEVERYGWRARVALQKQGAPLTVEDTDRIRAILVRLHDQVRHAFNSSTTETKSRKKAHRADAREYARLQLWMVGAILVNAEHRSLFHLSYATSVGMSRVQTIDRRALVTRTSERPSLGESGGQATAN